jgi:hypothetical protein
MSKKFLTVDQQEEIGILSAEVRARLAEGYRNGGDAPQSIKAPAEMAPPGQTALFNAFEDAQECAKCGGRMVRTGSCYTCRTAGLTPPARRTRLAVVNEGLARARSSYSSAEVRRLKSWAGSFPPPPVKAAAQLQLSIKRRQIGRRLCITGEQGNSQGVGELAELYFVRAGLGRVYPPMTQ